MMITESIVTILILKFVGGNFRSPGLRLVNNGVSAHYGFVQYDGGKGKWETLCGSHWSSINTRLVCTDLGLERGKHSINMMQLYGARYPRPDSRFIDCNSNDTSFLNCLERFHPESEKCKFGDFMPAFIVCSAGNVDNINFVYSPFYADLLWYKMAKFNKHLLVHGASWSKLHSKLASRQLGEGECRHEFVTSKDVNILALFKCNNTAKSLDDCLVRRVRGKKLVRLICFTNFEVDMSPSGLVEYFEIAHEGVNFTLTMEMDQPNSILIGYNFMGVDSTCEMLAFLPSRQIKPVNYLTEEMDVDLDLTISNSTYFSIRYTSTCEVDKESHLTHFEVTFAPLHSPKQREESKDFGKYRYQIYLLIVVIFAVMFRSRWTRRFIKLKISFY